MISRIAFSIALVLGVAVAAGCSVASEDAATGSAAASTLDETSELKSILGNDRVSKTLLANPTTIPNHFDKFETMFGIGRKCNRTDSHEIWVAEEKDTRITGAQAAMPSLMPRLAIGGCQQQPGNQRQTFEMMVAMVSDPSRDIDDAIPNNPVEVMALDNTTGLFNFYVLEPGATEADNATVSRFVRLADATVQKWTKVAGQPATKEDFPQGKCFNCHVHGGPIQNELTEPWTNWVSSHKTLSRPMTGATHALVSEARPFPGDRGTRSSLANQLEQVTRASIAMWVEGIPGVPGSGFGAQTIAGKQPGGMGKLLDSVLCQSEVNYETVMDTVPMSLFVDAAVASFANLQPPIPPISGASWTLLPVRSETDKRVELFLQKQKILTPDTVLAVRAFDDMHDIFSDSRCGLAPDVLSRISGGATPNDAIRASISAALDAQPAGLSDAQVAYLRVLVGTADDATRSAAESAYITDFGARLTAETAKLGTDDGLAELSSRWTTRQASARAMFNRPENPLPLTPVP